MKQTVCYYYEPNSIIRNYMTTHTDKERLFIKLGKSYTREPITNIKRYFISNKDIVRLFESLLRHYHSPNKFNINNFYDRLDLFIKER